MVKKDNCSVKITCTPSMLKNREVLEKFYDMTFTQLVKMLLAKEVAERKLG